MLDEALAYVANGWHVFPCLPLAKRPATRYGLKAASVDPDDIRRWWQANPDMNIGVNCGRSGLLVVDIDCKDVDGFASWCALGSQHGPWVDTLTVCTPTGGFHWYFIVESDELGNTASQLAEGIDTRCRGGYVVAPPSRTDDGAYVIDTDHPVAQAPDWLVELLRPPEPQLTSSAIRASGSYGTAALRDEIVRLAKAPHGQRNATLNRAAFSLGQLVAAGALNSADVARELTDAGLLIGLGATEVQRTIASGLRAGMTKPRSQAS